MRSQGKDKVDGLRSVCLVGMTVCAAQRTRAPNAAATWVETAAWIARLLSLLYKPGEDTAVYSIAGLSFSSGG